MVYKYSNISGTCTNASGNLYTRDLLTYFTIKQRYNHQLWEQSLRRCLPCEGKPESEESCHVQARVAENRGRNGGKRTKSTTMTQSWRDWRKRTTNSGNNTNLRAFEKPAPYSDSIRVILACSNLVFTRSVDRLNDHTRVPGQTWESDRGSNAPSTVVFG